MKALSPRKIRGYIQEAEKRPLFAFLPSKKKYAKFERSLLNKSFIASIMVELEIDFSHGFSLGAKIIPSNVHYTYLP